MTDAWSTLATHSTSDGDAWEKLNSLTSDSTNVIAGDVRVELYVLDEVIMAVDQEIIYSDISGDVVSLDATISSTDLESLDLPIVPELFTEALEVDTCL